KKLRRGAQWHLEFTPSDYLDAGVREELAKALSDEEQLQDKQREIAITAAFAASEPVFSRFNTGKAVSEYALLPKSDRRGGPLVLPPLAAYLGIPFRSPFDDGFDPERVP